MQANAIDYRIQNTKKDGNYEAEKQQAIQTSVTDIIICGGDGTINSIAA